MENINEKSDQFYLEKAPMGKAIMHLSIPMMLGMSIGAIYNIINAFFIGLTHDSIMLSAITFGLPVMTLLMALGSIWGVGGGTYISRLFGAKETEKIKNVSAFVLYGSMIFGVSVAILCMIFINQITSIVGADVKAFSATKNYISFLFLATPFLVANFTLEQIVRGEGAAKESMNGIIIGTIANLIFDVLLILVLNLNVIGAALAFALSNLCSLIYYIWYLQTKSQNIDLSFKYFSFDKQIIKEVFSIGISDFLMTSFLIVTSLLLNNFAVRYGDNVIAAFGVSLRIVQLPEFLCMGLFMGITPLIGYSFGANNKKRLESAMKQTAIAIALIVGVFSSAVYIFRKDVFSLFASDKSLIGIGIYILSVMLISTLFNGFTGLITSYFQATGKAKKALIMSISQGTLFIPTIIIANSLIGLHGIIFSMTIAEFITFLLGIFLYFYKKDREGNLDFAIQE
ncbi:MATE family efflux transporter [Clostridium sp. 'White wine YQ']|uniref:MATE family efflux transporter n=1 Tax=Clostridium sp. 'White wine YQ' TaxID=3027474 RepID=UPI002365C093|nr:MATE family efflux transporter [Clostridium sp. 'White wine YQ']MDD7794244.1 MATE family efflux transporter [Clostridium sp. 'White wine YQ']